MNNDRTQTPSASPSASRTQSAAPNTNKEEVAAIVINAFYTVYKTLGYGFLEKIYENALVYELREQGFFVEQQKRIFVHYKGHVMGEHFLDIVVEGCVICELKAAKELCEDHEAQLLNYLKATDIELGLLMNFGPKPKIKRKIFDNELK